MKKNTEKKMCQKTYGTPKGNWNLSLMFNGDTDPRLQKELKESEKEVMRFVKNWKARKEHLQFPKVMKIALDEYEALSAHYGLCGNVSYYWGLRSSQDEDDPKIKAQANKVHEHTIRIANELEFFELRIGTIKPGIQKRMLGSKELACYRHFLERAFQTAKYQLTEPEEKIMNIKSKTSHGNWVDMTSRFISREERVLTGDDGKKKKRPFSELSDLMNSPKKSVRDPAGKAYHEIVAQHSDVAEAEINSILENKKFNDQLRGYTRPDSARHVSDDIDSQVVDTLIKAVTQCYDISRRYYTLKSKLLNLKSLGYHERNVVYGNIRKNYTFNETAVLVGNVLMKLDPEFHDVFMTFLNNGQYDIYPRKGKTGVQFCASNLKTSPVYILLNHTGQLYDVLTLAHETGHGINDEFMKRAQNDLNIGSPTCIAEVSSTFFEDFVLQELLETGDEQFKLAVLIQKLNDDITSVFRQIAGYRFEQELHEKFRSAGYLSKDEIGKIFQKHMRSYLGPSVRMDKGCENWWVPWIHFRSFFYVYSFSSGLLISKALQRLVREDKKNIEKVKELLSVGTSQSPQEFFTSIGIDISKPGIWEQGIKETEELLDTADELAKSTKAI